MRSHCNCFFLVFLFIQSLLITSNCKEVSSNQRVTEAKIPGKVVLTATLLAPSKDSRALEIVSAKDFPSLMVIATDNEDGSEAENSNEDSSDGQPIYYVKKLDEVNQPSRYRRQLTTLLTTLN